MTRANYDKLFEQVNAVTRDEIMFEEEEVEDVPFEEDPPRADADDEESTIESLINVEDLQDVVDNILSEIENAVTNNKVTYYELEQVKDKYMADLWDTVQDVIVAQLEERGITLADEDPEEEEFEDEEVADTDEKCKK